MKKFKSILALTASVLALSAFAAPVSAFADEAITNTNGTWTGSKDTMNLSLSGHDAGYTVTIPATVTFADLSSKPTADIAAESVYLTTNLTVTASSTHDYKLVNDIDTSNANNITYTAKVGDSSDAVTSETVLLTVAAGTTTGSSRLNFEINSGQTINYAGDYKDTWTFTIAPSSPA